MKSYLSFVLLCTMVLCLSCTKNDTDNGNARVSVYLTDDPADYKAVWIDVQDVQVNNSTDPDNGWTSLHVARPGVYNLLTFRDGIDTVLTSVDVPAVNLAQIRLILGPNNSIETSAGSYPLETPSAQQSGLKINLQAALSPGEHYKVWLDFDAAKSIVETGNGKFILKPVITAHAE